MARILGTDYFEQRPEGVWSQEFHEWCDPIARRIYDEERDRERTDPLYLRGGLTDRYPMGHGIRFPDHPTPFKYRVTKMHGNVPPDFVAAQLFSERVKAKIEAIEPGVHQFFPVELELPDGSICSDPYWLCGNMNVLDALILAKSEHMYAKYPNKEKFPNYYRYEYNANGNPVWALNREVIAGKSLWLDYKLSKMFFSQELSKWMDTKGIKGWEESRSATQPITIIEV